MSDSLPVLKERTEMTSCEVLEHSFQMMRKFFGEEMSRLEFLADYIFKFTTYDSEMGELFATKALEVCAAISANLTHDYIKDTDNYRWFVLMVNMLFFAGRLEWGGSIRGAWWIYDDQTLESCGIWRGEKQEFLIRFNRDEWLLFVAGLIEFAACREPS